MSDYSRDYASYIVTLSYIRSVKLYALQGLTSENQADEHDNHNATLAMHTNTERMVTTEDST